MPFVVKKFTECDCNAQWDSEWKSLAEALHQVADLRSQGVDAFLDTDLISDTDDELTYQVEE